jgi:hypothetical protein
MVAEVRWTKCKELFRWYHHFWYSKIKQLLTHRSTDFSNHGVQEVVIPEKQLPTHRPTNFSNHGVPAIAIPEKQLPTHRPTDFSISCAELYVGLSVTSDLITWHDVVGSICEDMLVVVMMLQI